MISQQVAGRVFNFNREVKLTPAWRSRSIVSVAVGEGDDVFLVHRGSDYYPNVPWTRTMRGSKLSKVIIGTVPDDEKFVGQFGGQGEAAGEFTWPVAVALDNQRNAYVTDEWLNRVSVFDKEGNFLKIWGKAGSGEGEFEGPSGIAFGPDEVLYIVDGRNNRVQKYTKDGDFLGQWGEGGLNAPWGVTVDQHGNVYVADHENHRVQKFSPDGQPLATFGSYGTGDGQLNRPSDVAVDPDGDVYVCDWANDRIQIFGTDGAFITSLLGDAREPSKAAMGIIETNPEMVQQLHDMPDQAAIGRFSFPTGIAFDPEKHRILVTDSQRGRLQIYDKVKS